MKLIIFALLFSLSSTAFAQFSIHVRNQISRSNQAIENGDQSIYTRNELHTALQQLAKEQAVYEARQYRPSQPGPVQARPFTVPEKWKTDSVLNALAEIVLGFRAGHPIDAIAARRVYMDLMERESSAVLVGEAHSMLIELIRIYSAPDDNGRPTRSLTSDAQGWGEGSRVERDKAQRASEAQRGISVPLGDVLGFPLESIYGVETIIDVMAQRLEQKNIKLSSAYLLTIDLVKKFGMATILERSNSANLRTIQSLVIQLSGRAPFTEAVDQFIQGQMVALGSSKNSNAYKNAVSQLRKNYSSLALASDAEKKKLADALISRGEANWDVLKVPNKIRTCQDLFRG